MKPVYLALFLVLELSLTAMVLFRLEGRRPARRTAFGRRVGSTIVVPLILTCGYLLRHGLGPSGLWFAVILFAGWLACLLVLQRFTRMRGIRS